MPATHRPLALATARLAALLAFLAHPAGALETAAAESAAALIGAAAHGGLSTPQDYISRFVLYVRWPDDPAIKAWQVCVAAPASGADDTYATLTARERPFAVRHVTAADALDACQILDLSGIDAAAAMRFLQAHPLHGVLTVGDGKDFCSAGGLICLRLHEPQGGFEVNLSAVKNSGLAINAQLLMLARQQAAGAGAP